MEPHTPSQSSIEGILIPNAWDPHGNVTGLSLLCHDEREIPLDPASRFNPEFLKLLRQNIIASGLFDGGGKTFTVTGYSLR